MIPLHCPHCAAELDAEPAALAGRALRCPACGLAVQVRTGEAALGAATGSPSTASSSNNSAGTLSNSTLSNNSAGTLSSDDSAGTSTAPLDTVDYGTLFQPRALLEVPEERRSRGRASGGPAGTQPLARPDEPPRLPPPVRAGYLLRVGAPAGEERLALPSALVVIGREEADIDLGDRSVSARHCQIEAIGDEFFLRDLDSRNGTYLNGARVRYAELRPGDQLRAGRTVLVFRAEGDAFRHRGR